MGLQLSNGLEGEVLIGGRQLDKVAADSVTKQRKERVTNLKAHRVKQHVVCSKTSI